MGFDLASNWLTEQKSFEVSNESGLMASLHSSNNVAIGLTTLYVIAILLYGLLVIQSLLLAVLIALPGILLYLVWRYLL